MCICWFRERRFKCVNVSTIVRPPFTLCALRILNRLRNSCWFYPRSTRTVATPQLSHEARQLCKSHHNIRNYNSRRWSDCAQAAHHPVINTRPRTNCPVSAHTSHPQLVYRLPSVQSYKALSFFFFTFVQTFLYMCSTHRHPSVSCTLMLLKDAVVTVVLLLLQVNSLSRSFKHTMAPPCCTTGRRV